MSRIRTIKPSFFKNEDLAELPMGTRLLFIGIWCLADKEGRLLNRPKRIKAELFPYDSIDVDSQLSRLQSAGFIIKYEVGELKVIQIINFLKHQRITGTEATSESDLPGPPDGIILETTRKQQGNTEDDRKGIGKEGNGKDNGKPSLEDFKQYCLEKGYLPELAEKAFSYYDSADWKDSNGKQVKSWKQKLISVWFKPEMKIKDNSVSTLQKNEW